MKREESEQPRSVFRPRVRWTTLAETPQGSLLLILAIPILAFVILRLPSIAQNNFADAMFYLGYSRNFVDLVDRYGFIYYAVRFGPIFAEMSFAELFGPSAGFYLLRYLLCVAVAYSLHAVLARRYGRRAALLGVLAWSFSPLTARILLSTYVDSTVVPFTMMGLLLLLLRERHRPLRQGLVAGTLLCAGVSGNVYAGVTIALGMPSYFWLNADRPLRDSATELVSVLAGAVATLLFFTAIYDHLFGVRSLLQPAIDVTLRLAGGDAKQWTRPPEEWLFDSPHIYAPVLILAAALMIWQQTRDRLVLAAALYLALFVLFYWISDLVFDGYSLSFYPYFSYWQVPLMLAIGAVSCRLAGTRAPIAMLLTLAIAGPPVVLALTGAEAPAIPWLAAGAVIAIAGWVLGIRASAWRPYAAIGLIAAASLLQAGSPVYNMMLGKPDLNDRETVRAARELIDVLPRIAEDGKDLAFWYSSAPDRRVMMVQSVYLPFSRLRRPDNTAVELGPLTGGDAELLSNPQLAHLVILDFSPQRIDEGLAALHEAGVPYRLAQRRTLGSKRFTLQMAHLILEHPTPPPIATLPATAIRPDPLATIRYDASGAVLVTGPKVRNWDGVLDLHGYSSPDASTTVTVTLQVLEGRATLALIRRGQPDRVIQENLAPHTPTPVRVSVRANDGSGADLLAIRNAMEDGTRTVLRVLSVDIHQTPLSALAAATP